VHREDVLTQGSAQTRWRPVVFGWCFAVSLTLVFYFGESEGFGGSIARLYSVLAGDRWLAGSRLLVRETSS
jgi:hypothetical protein